ncbi:MAG TPA: thiamine pyrophosphate-requiring protein [Gemmatimonadales bacterium]|nr:thiamine pyrophosphate-requiring protein [Gemmatimonadales bacterium]
MAITVSDHLVARLGEWGVRRVFGYPGDGINGVMGALDRAHERIRFIRSTHEELAAFMACAHAKFTGELGVCVATSGPGAIHLLNGLYDARLDHQPVLAIVGQQSRKALGGSYQQEVDLLSLFKDVASEYVQMLVDPAQARHLIDRAARIALSERTVTCLIIPTDIQELDAVETPPREHGTVHSSAGYVRPRVVPPVSELERAAGVLNAGERVAMLVGAGALGAEEDVIAVADALGAGVAKALLGKAVVPDSLPFVTGPIGLLGTQPSWQMMQECDTLLMVGSSFPYSEFLPAEGKARAVQIDIDGRMLGIRYPTEVNLVGDARETLRALLPLLEPRRNGAWRETIADHNEEWAEVLRARAMEPAKPINPQRVFWELSPKLPDRCILTADSGTVAQWYARDLKIRSGMAASLSGTLATMGSAVPYAIAAKFAHPERVVIALSGDGAMQMIGNQALLTVARHWREWADPRLIVMVLNNRDLNMVTWEMRVMEGNPKFAASQDVDDFPYARYAELIGLAGIRVEDPDEIGSAWDTALSATRPIVVEFVTDPDVPPLPPHISLEQAKHFASALLKGDPDEGGVIRQTMRQVLASVR